jgi:hypothetical protein
VFEAKRAKGSVPPECDFKYKYEKDIKKAIQFIIVTSKLEKSFEFETLLEEVFIQAAEKSKSIFYTKFLQ